MEHLFPYGLLAQREVRAVIKFRSPQQMGEMQRESVEKVRARSVLVGVKHGEVKK